jgi:hypothetical protein
MPKEFQKKREVTLRSSFPRRGPGTDTVPDLDLPARLGVSTDTMPEQAGVYVPPRPLASASDHRTIEIAPVRLAQDIDPRRAPTELRLPAARPRHPARSGLLVLGALLAVAVGGFLAVRFLVPPASSPSLPSPKVAPASPPPAPTTPSPVIVGPPVSPPEADPEPATSAELGIRPKASPHASPPREPTPAPKKKPREPWLE